MAFRDIVGSILNRHLGGPYRILGEKSLAGGLGASVDVACFNLVIRVFQGRMAEFYIDVAAAREPEKWYELVYLLILASGEAPDASKVAVGHSLADLEIFVQKFARYRVLIVSLLDVGNVLKTQEQIREIKEITMDPAIRALLKTRPRAPGSS
jgi:hypothetical protein